MHPKQRAVEIGDYVRGRVAGGPAPAAAPAAASGPAETVSDQLRQLGELRDAGVLTQEEFDAKKAELLARM